MGIMGDALALGLLILVFVINYAAKSKQKKQKTAKPAAVRPQANDTRNSRTAAAKQDSTVKSASKKTPNDVIHDGSIEMPPIGPHTHEGKEMPCPAEERELQHQVPPKTASNTRSISAASPKLELSFSRNSVLQAVIMSEILDRPSNSGRKFRR